MNLASISIPELFGTGASFGVGAGGVFFMLKWFVESTSGSGKKGLSGGMIYSIVP